MSDTNRKLAVILAMDVVNYSAKMEQDEEKTLFTLRKCSEIIESIVDQKVGRIFNTAGDAFMIEFFSPRVALETAIEIQRKIRNLNENSKDSAMEFRMGLNFGDVMVDRDNLFGAGVNVAARLEGICPPGGICISEKMQTEIDGKFDFDLVDIGYQKLKNIDKPIKAFFVALPGVDISQRPDSSNSKRFSKPSVLYGVAASIVLGLLVLFFHSNDSKKSKETPALNTLAVLPLETLGGNQEQQIFGVGLSHDLGNGLSASSQGLNVINVGQRPENLGDLIDKSGAAYLVDGQIRIAGNSLRATVKLVDASSGTTLWTQTFDRENNASDVFALQDDIVKNVVDALVGNGAVLIEDIGKRIKAVATDQLSVYECRNFVLAVFLQTNAKRDYERSLECLKKAVKDDPSYPPTWQLFGEVTALGVNSGYVKESKTEHLLQALKYTDEAIRLDPESARAYAARKTVLMGLKDWPAMFEAIDKAVLLAPNDTYLLGDVGIESILGGDCSLEQMRDRNSPEEKYTSGTCQWRKGYQLLSKAHRLDPGNMYLGKHFALTILYNLWGEWDLAYRHHQLSYSPSFNLYELNAVIASHGKGSFDEAKQHAENLKKSIETDELSKVKNWLDGINLSSRYLPIARPILVQYGFKDN